MDFYKIPIILITVLVNVTYTAILCQPSHIANALNVDTAMDSLNKNRLKLLAIGSGSIYTVGSAGLYLTWYRDYPRSGFHLFNDTDEWRMMDKAGHSYSAYTQADLIYKGLRWSGLSNNKSIWYSALMGSIFQTTIEVMDGFSADWGFSLSDIAANKTGLLLFAIQQKIWDDQRIRLKFSAWPHGYPDDQIGQSNTTLSDRATALFGSSLTEKLLKDYNHQTYWLSVNVKSFYPDITLPQWMTISLGYGAANMYGGFRNEWSDNGQQIQVNRNEYPRYGQFYISLDADWDKVKTRSKWLGTILDFLNIIKMPFPAIEINTLGQIKFHLIHF